MELLGVGGPQLKRGRDPGRDGRGQIELLPSASAVHSPGVGAGAPGGSIRWFSERPCPPGKTAVSLPLVAVTRRITRRSVIRVRGSVRAEGPPDSSTPIRRGPLSPGVHTGWGEGTGRAPNSCTHPSRVAVRTVRDEKLRNGVLGAAKRYRNARSDQVWRLIRHHYSCSSLVLIL